MTRNRRDGFQKDRLTSFSAWNAGLFLTVFLCLTPRIGIKSMRKRRCTPPDHIVLLNPVCRAEVGELLERFDINACLNVSLGLNRNVLVQGANHESTPIGGLVENLQVVNPIALDINQHRIH